MIDRLLTFLLRLLPQGGGMVAVMEQEHFRVRDDTTTCNGGTPNWVSTEDQATNIVVDQVAKTYRIRFVAANSGSANMNDTLRVRVQVNGTGGFIPVANLTGNRSIVGDGDASVDTGTFGNVIDTANFLLTAGTGTALEGYYSEQAWDIGVDGRISNDQGNNIQFADGNYMEVEWGFRISGFVSGDEIEFRLYQDDGTAFTNYDVTPVLEISNNQFAKATINVSAEADAIGEGHALWTLRNSGIGISGTTATVRNFSFLNPTNKTAKAGNLLVSWICLKQSTDTPTVPPGWTAIVDQKNASANLSTRVAYKIADGTETNTGNWTWTNGSGVGGGILEISNGDIGDFLADPVDQFASAVETTSTTSQDSGTTAAQSASDNGAFAFFGFQEWITGSGVTSFTNSYVTVASHGSVTDVPWTWVGFRELSDTSAQSTVATLNNAMFGSNHIVTFLAPSTTKAVSATSTVSGSIPVAVGSGGADGTPRQNITFGVFGTSTTINFGSACESGHLIVVNAVADVDGSTISATGWSVAVNRSDAANGETKALLWKVSDGTETSVTVQATGSPTLMAGSVVEYNGSYQSSPVDQTASDSGDSTTPVSGTTAAQSVSGNLAVAALTTNGIYSMSGSWSNSYVERNNHIYSLYNTAQVSKVLADALATSTAGSTLASSQDWEGVIATFKFAVGGTVTATATSTVQPTLVGDGKSRAFATATISATTTATSASLGRATATVLGDNGSTSINLGFATIDFIGTLIAGGGTQFASATSTVSPTVTAVGTVNATATATVSGTATASGINLARATATVLGDNGSLSTNLASATSTSSLAVAAIGTSLGGTVTPTATVNVSSFTIAVGTSRAAATITASATLVAGGGTQFALATATLSNLLTANSRTNGTGIINVSGTVTATATGLIFAAATSNVSATQAGVGTNLARATATVLGDQGSLATNRASTTVNFASTLTVGGGTHFSSATSTVSATVAAIGTDTTANLKTALATINVSATNVSRGTSRAFATSTVSASVTSTSASLGRATATVLGDQGSLSTLLAIATISTSGEVAASGIQRASGTINVAGDLAAIGTQLTGVTTATATVNVSGLLTVESIAGIEGRDSVWLTATTNASKFDFGLGDYTVEFLYRAPRLGIGSNAIILDQRAATGEGWQITQAGSNHLSARISDGTITRVVTALNVIFDDEDIHHCAVIFDRTSDNLEIFVDGTSRASTTYDIIGSLTSGEDFRILGKDGDQSWRYGLLSEIRVWNDIRTLQEIQDNRDVKMVGNEANLIALYPCSKGPHGVPLTEIGTDNQLDDLCASPAHAGWQEHLTTYFTKTRTDNNRIQWWSPVVAAARPAANIRVFQFNQVQAVGTPYAKGVATINVFGSQAGLGTVNATATINVSGTVAANGTIPGAANNASSTVNVDAQLTVGGGTQFALATITIIGDSAGAVGDILVPATATINVGSPGGGGGFIELRSTSDWYRSGEDGLTNLTRVAPADRVVGDLLMVFIVGTNQCDIHTNNAGWTAFAAAAGWAGWWKFADGDSSDNFTLENTTTSSIAAIMACFDTRNGFYDNFSVIGGGGQFNNDTTQGTGWHVGNRTSYDLFDRLFMFNWCQKSSNAGRYAGSVEDTMPANYTDVDLCENIGTTVYLGQTNDPNRVRTNWVSATYAVVNTDAMPAIAFGNDWYKETPDTGSQVFLNGAQSFYRLWGSADPLGFHPGFNPTGGPGDLQAKGTILETTSATVNVSGRVDAYPDYYTPRLASASIAVSATVTAVENPADDIVPASATISLTSQVDASLYFYADDGRLLARTTIFVTGNARAEVSKVTCLQLWADMNVRFTMSAIAPKTPKATMIVNCLVTAVLPWPARKSIDLFGTCRALGRVLSDASLDLAADRNQFRTNGLIGRGDINGNKKAIINIPYGSLQIYNNSRGEFYTIGRVGALKDVGGQMNAVFFMSVIGSKDQTKFATATTTGVGIVTAADGVFVTKASIVPWVSIFGTQVSGKGTTRTSATINVSGSVAANARLLFVVRLDDDVVIDRMYESQEAKAGIRIDNNGKAYEVTNDFGLQVMQSDWAWIRPTTARPSAGVQVRATEIYGNVIGTLNIWLDTDVDREWVVIAPGLLNQSNSRNGQVLLEFSDDGGATILDSAYITMNAFSRAGDVP